MHMHFIAGYWVSIDQEGDIVNIDVTCFFDGFHGDCSETFLVGEVDEAGRNLVKTTFDCFQAAIDRCSPGTKYNQIGAAIEDWIDEVNIREGTSYSSVREFRGHGIGREFHCDPKIWHFRHRDWGSPMKAGHTFTIEPAINEGTNELIRWPDGWTAATADGKRSAQFEHTMLVTPGGAELLTGKVETSPLYFWEEEERQQGGGVEGQGSLKGRAREKGVAS